MAANIFKFNKNQKYSSRYDIIRIFGIEHIDYYFNLLFFVVVNYELSMLWLTWSIIKKETNKKKSLFNIIICNDENYASNYVISQKTRCRMALIPLPIHERKQYTYAVKWIKQVLRIKTRIIKIPDLVQVLLMATWNRGAAYEKKLFVYKTSIENRHLLRFFRR